MTRISKYVVAISVSMGLLVVGCATVPAGPSVMVMPGLDKTFEEFQMDDYVCRQWAQNRIGHSVQDLTNKNIGEGAVAGSLVGAGVGAAIGSASGKMGSGAAIGAGVGLLGGLLSGADAGRVYGYEAQRRYDIAYSQCMYSKGNQIGSSSRTRSSRQYIPPPPPPGAGVPPDYDPPSVDDDTVPPDYRRSSPPPPASEK